MRASATNSHRTARPHYEVIATSIAATTHLVPEKETAWNDV